MLSALAALGYLAACPGSPGPVDAGPFADATVDLGPNLDDGAADLPVACEARDDDMDGLTNAVEGCCDPGVPTDTDADGTPDCTDTDSDDDGLLDALEGANLEAGAGPPDSDGDGIADWRDLDSDGNGIPDREDARFEGDVAGDLDGDGVADFRDADDDGDELSDVDEIGGNPATPRDTDADGSPDFRDLDSDGDTIADAFEIDLDGDCDGIINALDLDSDGDGLSDAEEAGDEDLATLPVDSDADGVRDFLDLDSDDDGLDDAEERELGSDSTQRDSDGDGVDDLIEWAAGTGLTDRDDTPASRGVLLSVIPFRQPPIPAGLTYSAVLDPALEGTLGTSAPEVVQRIVDDASDTVDVSTFVSSLSVDAEGAGCHVPAMGSPEGGFAALPLGATACFEVEIEANRSVGGETEAQVFRGTVQVEAEGRNVLSRSLVLLVPADSVPVLPPDTCD